MNPQQPEEQKNCPCKSPKDGTSRRDFLLMVGVALNAIAGAMIGIPIIGYIISSFVQKYPLQWISLGTLSKFPEGATRLASYKNPYHREWDGVTADIPCWVRHVKDNEFQIFAINCTHLGCPVRWFDESKLFMCPCHGGVFYENGAHAAGPPPRGLYEYSYKVENNQLFVQAGMIPTLADPKV